MDLYVFVWASPIELWDGRLVLFSISSSPNWNLNCSLLESHSIFHQQKFSLCQISVQCCVDIFFVTWYISSSFYLCQILVQFCIYLYIFFETWYISQNLQFFVDLALLHKLFLELSAAWSVNNKSLLKVQTYKI